MLLSYFSVEFCVIVDRQRRFIVSDLHDSLLEKEVTLDTSHSVPRHVQPHFAIESTAFKTLCIDIEKACHRG